MREAAAAVQRALEAGVKLAIKDAELPAGPVLKVLKETMMTYKRAFDALRPPASIWSEVCSVMSRGIEA
jgi:hypothetical protein